MEDCHVYPEPPPQAGAGHSRSRTIMILKSTPNHKQIKRAISQQRCREMKIIKDIRKIKDQLSGLNTSSVFDFTHASNQGPTYAQTGKHYQTSRQKIHKQSVDIEEGESTSAYQTTTAAKNIKFDSNEVMDYSDEDDIDENGEFEDYNQHQNINLERV